MNLASKLSTPSFSHRGRTGIWQCVEKRKCLESRDIIEHLGVVTVTWLALKERSLRLQGTIAPEVRPPLKQLPALGV